MNHAVATAVQGFHRNRAYYLLCSLIIALGVSGFAAMSSVLAYLYANPAGTLETVLFHPNYTTAAETGAGASPNTSGMPWADAEQLGRAAQDIATSAAFVSGNLVLVHEPEVPHPRTLLARFTTHGFFEVFGIPLVAGSGWTQADDENAERVVVISDDLSRQLFGTNQAVGKLLRLDDIPFRIIGVAEMWNPKPHFHDLGQGGYADFDKVYIPLRTARSLKSSINAAISCGNGAFPNPDELENSDCSWIQLWLRAKSIDGAAQLRSLVAGYGSARAGTTKDIFTAYSTGEWIRLANLVPSIVRAQALISLGFLLACIINVAAILLVISLRAKHTIGIHRALGAKQRDIVFHMLLEAGGIASLGAVGGVAFVFVIFAVLRLRPEDYYHGLTASTGVVALSVALSFAATLVAALLPAVYMSKIPPIRLLASY